MYARVPPNDRVQRILIGSLLMALNIVGLMRSPDWLKWTALALQVELIATGLAGWCPLYWCMGRHRAG
jgi:hypothetical protein